LILSLVLRRNVLHVHTVIRKLSGSLPLVGCVTFVETPFVVLFLITILLPCEWTFYTLSLYLGIDAICI
jgi:hypothetical protein